MGLGHLDEDQGDAVGVGHLHLVQTPRLFCSRARDRHTAAGQLLLGGVHVAHLQPQRPRGVRSTVAGQLDQ
jgi:hypothetical protein